MKNKTVFYSPRICYEVTSRRKSCDVNVYIEGFGSSDDPSLHCILRDFSADRKTAVSFVESVSSSCALPVHIPQLAKDFFSR